MKVKNVMTATEVKAAVKQFKKKYDPELTQITKILLGIKKEEMK